MISGRDVERIHFRSQNVAEIALQEMFFSNQGEVHEAA